MNGSGAALLESITVVELGTDGAEFAGRTLADLGAEVIRVEPPGGSASRRRPPFDERNGSGESLHWASVALGKRSVVLDLDITVDIARLTSLLHSADVLVESFEPGTLESKGLGYQVLSAANPGLICVSISAYGQTGPAAGRPATSLTIEAAGGLLGFQGDGDRPPVPVGHPQAWAHAGVQAAADTVIALNERYHSGLGQHLDVSAQAAMVWTLMHATGFPPNTGSDPPETGAERKYPSPEIVAGTAVPGVYECTDGYVTAALGAARTGTLAAALEWWDKEEGLEADLKAIDWSVADEELLAGRLTDEQLERAKRLAARLIARKTKAELMEWAVDRRLFVAAIYDMDDLPGDPHLTARDYWRQIDGRKHPGPAAILSRTPMGPVERSPWLGEHQGLLNEIPPVRAAPSEPSVPRGSAFADIRVADFAWIGVGPITTKALADHGATVVRIEFEGRPDGLRMAPPFKHDEPGIDRSQFYADFNSSKLSVSIDLSNEAGRELARRLIAWSNVVAESFAPGAMKRMGMDFDSLAQERPDLIMYSTCLRGQTGPEAPYRGVGYQGAALAGFYSVTGWPDRPPVGPWAAYTDFVAPRYGIAALAGAIRDRRRTGLGQYIDLSQTEAAIHFLEPLVLDYTVNGRVAGLAGHLSLTASPHGTFAVAGKERYVAVAVETAAQWRGLRRVVPLDYFDGEQFDQLETRLAEKEAIETALRSWLVGQRHEDALQTLIEAGVPAALVQRPSDLYADPQLAHREFFVDLDHPVMGPTPYDGLVTRFSAKPEQLRKAAPALGEDTDYVLRELLCLTNDEIGDFAARGAFG